MKRFTDRQAPDKWAPGPLGTIGHLHFLLLESRSVFFCSNLAFFYLNFAVFHSNLAFFTVILHFFFYSYLVFFYISQ